MNPRLRAAILRWYARHCRDLPWRRTRDPYAVWISEIMLQQTRVETVIPYYERFLQRFPDPRSLATSDEKEVLAAWSGLGYYRRARHLHAAAAGIVRDHGGALPASREALRKLPGVGDYTAAAIRSIAFGHPEPAVDGNVVRVLSRIRGLKGRRDSPRLRREARLFAERLARGPRPGDWTQALMELGATVCLPREPRCTECPARPSCAASAEARPDRYPGPARARAPKRDRLVMLLAWKQGRVLMVREEADRRSWTLPLAPRSGAPRSAAAALARRLDQRGPLVGPVARFRHRTYSHDLELELWEVASGRGNAGSREESRLPRRAGRDFPRSRWISPDRIADHPVRSPTLKALRLLRRREAPLEGAIRATLVGRRCPRQRRSGRSNRNA